MSSCEVLLESAEHLGLASGYYLISNMGRIWSFSLKKFLSPVVNPNGYVTPVLRLANGTVKACYIHVLVIETFLGRKTPDGMVIDHVNQDKGDNRLSNLRFATLSENVINRDWTNHGVGQKKPVIRYTLDGTYLDDWPSANHAAEQLGLYGSTQISLCCTGNAKTAYNYIWKYKEDVPLAGEVWKRLYDVDISNYGRIRSDRNVVTYGSKTINGYYGVSRKGVSYLVHRIVCEAFNGAAPAGKDIVDHLDGDKLNNLQWVSHAENMQRAVRKSKIHHRIRKSVF